MSRQNISCGGMGSWAASGDRGSGSQPAPTSGDPHQSRRHFPLWQRCRRLGIPGNPFSALLLLFFSSVCLSLISRQRKHSGIFHVKLGLTINLEVGFKCLETRLQNQKKNHFLVEIIPENIKRTFVSGPAIAI